MFPPTLVVGRDLRTHTTANVGSEQNVARNPKELTVVIFSDPDPGLTIVGERLEKLCVDGELGAKHVALSDPKLLLSQIKKMRADGIIGDSTQVFVNLHGAINDAGQHILGGGAKTLDVVSAIREPQDNGQSCNANVYIGSCHSGHEELRDGLETLLNESPGGACFLMSSKKTVLSSHLQKVQQAVCEEFIRTGPDKPPSLTLIHARMLSDQEDCISKIEPNMEQVIRHAPREESDIGIEALIREIESRLPAEQGPSPQAPPNPAGDVGDASRGKVEGELSSPDGKVDGTKAAKPHLIGGEHSLRQLLMSARDLPKRKDMGRNEGIQKKAVLDRKVNHALDVDDLKAALASDAQFSKLLSGEDWNDSHLYTAAVLLQIVSLDENEDAKEQKLNYLLELLEKRKSSLHRLDNSSLSAQLAAMTHFSLVYLAERGWFIKPEQEGVKVSVASRISCICAELAKRATKDYMADFLERQPEEFLKDLVEIRGDTYPLLVKMLSEADREADDRSREAKKQYLLDKLMLNPLHPGRLRDEALRQVQDVSQTKRFLEKIPRPTRTDPGPCFELLQTMFLQMGGGEDISERRHLLFGVLEPQLDEWVQNAPESAVQQIFSSAQKKSVDGEWDESANLLVIMFGAALEDQDKERGDRKCVLIRELLGPKLEILQNHPDKESIIDEMAYADGKILKEKLLPR